MQTGKSAFRAGLVVLSALVIGIYFFVSSRNSTINERNASLYYAFLENASGLSAKSLVTVAGLQVGIIEEIKLVEVTRGEFTNNPEIERVNDVMRVARVNLRINKDVTIPEDSRLRKESLGLLGSQALFLDIGTSPVFLQDGERIVRVKGVGGMDALFGKMETLIDRIDDNLTGIVADIKGITGQLNTVVTGGDGGDDFAKVYRDVMAQLQQTVGSIKSAVESIDGLVDENNGTITALLNNINGITGDIRQITENEDGRGDVQNTVRAIRQVSTDLALITGKIRDVVGENDGEIDRSITEFRQTLARLNRSLESIANITAKVERGEGAAGKLLADERLGQQLESAIAGASDYITDVTSLETHVDMGAYQSLKRQVSNVSFQLRLQPAPDKYYFLEVVSDRGYVESVNQTGYYNDQNAIGDDIIVRRERSYQIDNRIRITAMYAKIFYDFLVVRAGILETSGGLGMDFKFLNDRIILRNDLFNFTGPRDLALTGDPFYDDRNFLPRLRTMLKIQPVPFFYLNLGIDDPLNSINFANDPNFYSPDPFVDGYGLDYIFGVGLRFTDSDLRAILPFLP